MAILVCNLFTPCINRLPVYGRIFAPWLINNTRDIGYSIRNRIVNVLCILSRLHNCLKWISALKLKQKIEPIVCWSARKRKTNCLPLFGRVR